jgi:hypothetical protein
MAPDTDLIRPAQALDLHQRPSLTDLQLVHTEEVVPLSSMKGQVTGIFTALADYWRLTSSAWSGELPADLLLP